MKNTGISIIIPTYNREKLIINTINSILEQTSVLWECIIVDDKSTDNTKMVVEKFMTIDDRIKYFVNVHKKGAQGARNTGVEQAKFDWVLFFDSDNLLHKDFIEKMIVQIKNGVDVIKCASDIVDVNKGSTGRVMYNPCNGDIHNSLFDGSCYVDFNQAIIRKEKVFEIGLLDEYCPSMQEWDTHIRLSNTCIYRSIDDILVDYFIGGKDAISSDNRREVRGRMYILSKHINEWRQKKVESTHFCAEIIRLSLRTKSIGYICKTVCKILAMCPYILYYVPYLKIRNIFI